VKVSEAVESRFSCRAFLDAPVDPDTVRRILDIARRAPSGGNLQPWHVYVACGDTLRLVFDTVRLRMRDTPRGDGAEYSVYPAPLKDPYEARRFKCGEDLYATIDVARADKAGRIAQFRRNFEMFGAPVGLFFYIDRTMGPPQWADMGMFAQTIMLTAREFGLDTCAQEAWAAWHATLAEILCPPDELMLFCGMGLGYRDPSAPINTLVTERASLDEFVSFV
jgi:nitroreductase